MSDSRRLYHEIRVPRISVARPRRLIINGQLTDRGVAVIVVSFLLAVIIGLGTVIGQYWQMRVQLAQQDTAVVQVAQDVERVGTFENGVDPAAYTQIDGESVTS